MIRQVLSALGLIGLGIALALLVVDLGVRIANHWFPYFYCYDAERGWGLNPGAHGWYTREGRSYLRINHDGFRGPDYPLTKPPDTIRVAVLGDSYVEAMQVAEDKTFTAVIARELAESPILKGRKVEALNFGVDGYGTLQELITLQRKVWKYHPDIVVLAIFLGNDVRNNSVALEPDQCRPFLVPENGRYVAGGPFIDSPGYRLWCEARFDYRDLRLFDLFKNTLEVMLHGGSGPTPQHPIEQAINYNIYKPPVDQTWREAWAVTETEVTMVRDEAARHGAMFLAVTEENGIQAWPVPAVRIRFQKHLGVPDLFYPDRRIAALGDREGFAVLMLAPPMQAYAEAHRVFLHGFSNTPAGFGHWNEAGHQEAGTLIAARLAAMIAARQCPKCGIPTRGAGPSASGQAPDGKAPASDSPSALH